MLYQLPDGRTVEISLEVYLEASDDDLKSLLGMNFGIVLNNPMYGSVINKPGGSPEDTDFTDEFSDHDYTADDE